MSPEAMQYFRDSNNAAGRLGWQTSRCRVSSVLRIAAMLSVPAGVFAQESNDLKLILERLERLEQENRNLANEVQALRQELHGNHRAMPPGSPNVAADGSAGPEARATNNQLDPPQRGSQGAQATESREPLAEQLAVQRQHIADLAQTKVEASQRFPISLTGMVLFNGFMNGTENQGEQYPLTAATGNVAGNGGGSPMQSIVGLKFQGPAIMGGGRLNGAAYLDLWGGTSSSLNHLVRLRVATVSIDWKNQSLMVGQDKPIVAPRNPDSLAQVAFSPLTGAGNLWLWQPQVRFEQRFSFGENAGVKAAAGIYQTSEPASSAGTEYAPTLSPSRPAAETRIEFWKNVGANARIEIAPGFHASNTHVAGASIPSRLFTLDWLIRPIPKFELTGAYFAGENAAVLGGLRQGFTIADDAGAKSIHAMGGWAQAAYIPTSRLTFNLFGGQESDRPPDLLTGQIARNLLFGANALYRIGPNVLVGVEASEVRTTRVGLPIRFNNHYDVALAYLF